RDFFQEASGQPWFSQTLFVLVADHSHENQRRMDFEDGNFHRIPLIFYGPALKPEFRGKKIAGVFSQLDIVPTLLHQLGVKSDHYSFAKNMLNPYSNHFAYFYFFHGTGMITDQCFASFR